MRTNSTLTELNISGNNLGNRGASALAGALHVNSALTKLGLSLNGIDDDGAAALGAALRVNRTLTCLHLGRNRVGTAGAAALGEALRVNAVVGRASAVKSTAFSRRTVESTAKASSRLRSASRVDAVEAPT